MLHLGTHELGEVVAGPAFGNQPAIEKLQALLAQLVGAARQRPFVHSQQVRHFALAQAIPQTQPEQQVRRVQTGFTGTSTAGVIEFVRANATKAGVLGSEILDYLQQQKGVENRETARKAITRTREMGFIRKDAQNRWHATDKLKELPS